jgi:hypothetical protein
MASIHPHDQSYPSIICRYLYVHSVVGRSRVGAKNLSGCGCRATVGTESRWIYAIGLTSGKAFHDAEREALVPLYLKAFRANLYVRAPEEVLAA